MSSQQLPDAYGDPEANPRDDDEAVDDCGPLLGERPLPVKNNSRLLLLAGPALLLRHVVIVQIFSPLLICVHTAPSFARWISLTLRQIIAGE